MGWPYTIISCLSPLDSNFCEYATTINALKGLLGRASVLLENPG